MEIELDLETGKFEILDYLGVADCGTVIHPMGLETQDQKRRSDGHSASPTHERHIYDPQNGLPGNVGLLHGQAAVVSRRAAEAWPRARSNIPDPQNPVGAKGVGEPVHGCAAAALLCAISDALGGRYFNRTPVVPDMIVNAVAGQPQSHGPLDVNTA